MAARNSICKKVRDIKDGTVTFNFSNEKAVTFNVNDLDQDGLVAAAVFGINHVGGDSYAGDKTPDAALKSLTTKLEAIEKGDWTVRTPGEPRTAVLVESLARAAGKTIEEAQLVIDMIKDEVDSEKTEEENAEDVKAKLKALNSDPAIKKAKAEIAMEKAEKEAEGADSAIAGLF